MATIDFGLMIQPVPRDFAAGELFEYNRRLARFFSLASFLQRLFTILKRSGPLLLHIA